MSNDDFENGRKDSMSVGTKIRGKLKRGDGTYNQDEIVIEGRGSDAEEAAADFEKALTEAEARGWADRLRAIQPEDKE